MLQNFKLTVILLNNNRIGFSDIQKKRCEDLSFSQLSPAVSRESDNRERANNELREESKAPVSHLMNDEFKNE